MKRISFLLVVLLFQGNLMAQKTTSDLFKHKAVYELTHQPDSTDASSVTSEEMWLYLGDKISKFSSKGKAMKDSLARNKNISGFGNNFQARAEMTKTEFDYAVYKDIPEDRISYTLKILGDNLRYEEDMDLFEWEILPETSTIKGYNAQKAKTQFRGREYTAWFTLEIPISDGPYKFHGLPGLILQLEDGKRHYIFELTGFENLEEPVRFDLEMDDYILTTKEKLLQQKRKFEEDPFAALENANKGSTKKVTIKISKKEKREHLERIREELEKKNNPIELE